MSALPQRFGKYNIIEFIGEGGFGAVYKAEDTTLERTVALKLLHPALNRDQAFIQRFEAEAKMAAQLEHPNIVRVYEVGDVDGRRYLAMEYVDGKSLAQLLSDVGRLPAQQALQIARSVASALEAAHRKRMTHRDVKPSNILIRSDGMALLADFGLAKAVESSYLATLTTSSQIIGTLRYMSPEQAEQGQLDHRADIYSLGVVLYEMLTGRPPFTGDTAIQLIRAHADHEPPAPSQFNRQITPAVESVILTALAKDPERRFASAKEMAHALEQAVTKGIVVRRGPVHVSKAKPKHAAKRSRVWSLVAGFSAVVCVIAAIIVVLLVNKFGSITGAIPTSTTISQAKPPHMATLAQPTASAPTPEEIEPTETPEPSATSTQPPPTVIPEPTIDRGGTMTAEVQAMAAAVAATLTAQPTATTARTSTPTTTQTPVATPAPTATPASRVEDGLPPAYQIDIADGATQGGQGAMVIRLARGDGEAIKNQRFRIYGQKRDLADNWVIDGSSIVSGYTDSAGTVAFDLDAGLYILSSDFIGNNWGDAYEVEGKHSVPVEAGNVTTVRIALAQLLVGFRYGDGAPVENQRVRIYTQQQDLAGNWVTEGSSVASVYTNNAGTGVFDLVPGYYIVSSDFDGYNWGNAYDVEGVSDYAVLPGQVTRLVADLGTLVVGATDTSGTPLENVRVRVYFQEKDISNTPIAGDSILSAYTDNSGAARFDLTPGQYVVSVDGSYTYNVPVEAGHVWNQWAIHRAALDFVVPFRARDGAAVTAITGGDRPLSRRPAKPSSTNG